MEAMRVRFKLSPALFFSLMYFILYLCLLSIGVFGENTRIGYWLGFAGLWYTAVPLLAHSIIHAFSLESEPTKLSDRGLADELARSMAEFEALKTRMLLIQEEIDHRSLRSGAAE